MKTCSICNLMCWHCQSQSKFAPLHCVQCEKIYSRHVRKSTSIQEVGSWRFYPSLVEHISVLALRVTCFRQIFHWRMFFSMWTLLFKSLQYCPTDLNHVSQLCQYLHLEADRYWVAVGIGIAMENVSWWMETLCLTFIADWIYLILFLSLPGQYVFVPKICSQLVWQGICLF